MCTCSPTAGVCDLAINRIDPPCKNEGKCVNTGVLEYRCECLPGYEGRYCQIRINYGQSVHTLCVYVLLSYLCALSANLKYCTLTKLRTTYNVHVQ